MSKLPPPSGATLKSAFRLPWRNEEIDVYISGAQPTSASESLLVFFHGGMFNNGTLYDASSFVHALSSFAVVVNVDYPLAPRFQFPETVEVAYEAVRWAASNAEVWGANPKCIFVGGEQAGGNLAAAATLVARDRKGLKEVEHGLAGQLLLSPLLDPEQTSFSIQNSEDQACRRGWSAYLPLLSDALHPYAAPLHSRRLGNLPRTLIITGEQDPFRDEGEAYANALSLAGVPVETRRFRLTQGDLSKHDQDRFTELINVAADFLQRPSP